MVRLVWGALLGLEVPAEAASDVGGDEALSASPSSAEPSVRPPQPTRARVTSRVLHQGCGFTRAPGARLRPAERAKKRLRNAGSLPPELAQLASTANRSFLADPRLSRIRVTSAIDARGTTFRYRAVAEFRDGTSLESFDAGESDADGRIALILTFAGPLAEAVERRPS